MGSDASSKKRKLSSNSAKDHLLSGALSGLASSIILQPLDLVKTRLQQGTKGRKDVILPSTSQGSSQSGYESVKGSLGGQREALNGKKALNRGIIPAFRRVVSEEGVSGLWRGTTPTIVRNVPGVAVYFYLLNEIRSGLAQTGYFAAGSNLAASKPAPPIIPIPASLTGSKAQALANSISPASSRPAPSIDEQVAKRKSSALPKLSSQGNLIAGAVARTSVGFVLSPFTVIKSRYESGLYPHYSSITSSLRHLIGTHGVRGLFQGFTATAVRDAPYAGFYVVFYEEMKELTSKILSVDNGFPPTGIHTLSGMSAAVLATLITSPADCVKTKMQVLPESNPSIRAAVEQLWKERGISGFFSGSTLRISRKAASSAIGWSVYEGLLLLMSK